MGFKLEQEDDKRQVYVLGDLRLYVFDYVYESKWYHGTDDKGNPIQHSRVAQRQCFTWRDKRFNSAAFNWDEIDALEEKINRKEEDYAEDKSIDDQGVQQGQLLSDEAKGVLRGENAPDDSNRVNA